jgi:hypothetical protein
MSATTRRRQSAPTFEILDRTTHYRYIGGRLYRDCVARRSDGALRLIALPVRDAA